MPGFNPDKINIHELAIEEPEKHAELPFDPERDIAEEDWRGMRDELEELRRDDTFRSLFPSLAMAMKVLNSTQDSNLSSDEWQYIRDKSMEDDSWSKWLQFADYSMYMKILDPNQSPGIDQTAWRGMEGALEEAVVRDIWRVPSHAKAMRILDPHRDLNLGPVIWQRMKATLEAAEKNNGWDTFTYQAADMRILDPGLKFNLDQNAWQHMTDRLKWLKQGNDWREFAKSAMAMKVLAAEEVKVTDRGLEINMRKPKLKENTPSLPETKQF